MKDDCEIRQPNDFSSPNLLTLWKLGTPNAAHLVPAFNQHEVSLTLESFVRKKQQQIEMATCHDKNCRVDTLYIELQFFSS